MSLLDKLLTEAQAVPDETVRDPFGNRCWRPPSRLDGIAAEHLLGLHPGSEHAIEVNGVELSDADILADTFTTSCGCLIEPDGTCPHGERSPLLEAGLI